MNYIKLAENAMELCIMQQITKNDYLLYMRLFSYANKSFWKFPIYIPTAILTTELQINRNQLCECRNRLVQKKLIRYKEGVTKTKSASYEILCINLDTQPDTQPDTILLKQKQKQNKTNEKSKKDFSEFDFSFLEKDFENCFFQWLEYKQKRKEKYKTQKSLELCFDKLKKLSKNNAETAQQIVNQSMANNWAGLFELKNQNQKSAKFGTSEQAKEFLKNL